MVPHAPSSMWCASVTTRQPSANKAVSSWKAIVVSCGNGWRSFGWVWRRVQCGLRALAVLPVCLPSRRVVRDERAWPPLAVALFLDFGFGLVAPGT